MKTETVKFTVFGRKATLKGDRDAVRKVLEAFVRGAAEMHCDDQAALGRTREEVVAEMVKRIRIAGKHFELGESDGFTCDLSDA